MKPVHESDRLLFPSTFQSSSKVFLVQHPDLYELTSLHQYTSAESRMTLLSVRIIELSVQYDDDK